MNSISTIEFLGKVYHLGGFNTANDRPMWEFAPEGETIHRWITQLTLIDRPDAVDVPSMNLLGEGIADYYKTAGGQILLSNTMTGEDGKTFNYLVAAFNEPKERQFEINFVKLMMGAQHALTIIYGVRITGADYSAKANTFIDEQASEIGHALAMLVLPPLDSLRRGV